MDTVIIFYKATYNYRSGRRGVSVFLYSPTPIERYMRYKGSIFVHKLKEHDIVNRMNCDRNTFTLTQNFLKIPNSYAWRESLVNKVKEIFETDNVFLITSPF